MERPRHLEFTEVRTQTRELLSKGTLKTYRESVHTPEEITRDSGKNHLKGLWEHAQSSQCGKLYNSGGTSKGLERFASELE